MEGLQKVVRWFLDADDSPNSHQNLIITFWTIYNVPWNLHENLFYGICNKSTNEQAKSMRKQLISFAQVIKFSWNIKLKGGGLTPTPTPPCVRPWLRPMNVIRSHHHEVLTEQVNKIALSADDDKREICDNKKDTFAHGHFTTTTTVHDVWAKNRNT